VNIIRKDYKPRIGMCKDKMGNLVTEKKKVLQRWAELTYLLTYLLHGAESFLRN